MSIDFFSAGSASVIVVENSADDDVIHIELRTPIRDASGRLVGAKARIWQDADEWQFQWWVRSTRDGKIFGASTRTHDAAHRQTAVDLAVASLKRTGKRIEAVAAKNGGVYHTASSARRAAKAK